MNKIGNYLSIESHANTVFDEFLKLAVALANVPWGALGLGEDMARLTFCADVGLKSHGIDSDRLSTEIWSAISCNRDQLDTVLHPMFLASDERKPLLASAPQVEWIGVFPLTAANPSAIHPALRGYVLLAAPTSRQLTPDRISALQVLVNQLANYGGIPLHGTPAFSQTAVEPSSIERVDANVPYRSMFENALSGMYRTDLNGQYLAANPMLAKILGYDSADDLRKAVTNVAQQLYADPRQRFDLEQSVLEHSVVEGYEAQVFRKDGALIWLSESVRLLRNSDGEPMGYEGCATDVTIRRHDRDMIEFMAYYDVLTGLANRMLFGDRLTLALAQARRNREMLAVLFLDLDCFKAINDTLGHGVGDILLQQVAQRLQDCLREGDTIARWGGDEFTVLLPDLHSTQQAIKLSQRILRVFQPPFDCEGHKLHVTCSIGIALYPLDGDSGQVLLKHADAALYRAKDCGRNTYELYTSTSRAKASAELTLESQLCRALAQQEFHLFFQPQIDLASGGVIGTEALLRWAHPQLQLLPPSAFSTLAEETGEIVPIGEWVLQSACQQTKFWQSRGFPHLQVAVNMSVRQFQQPNLVSTIEDILLTTGLPPSCLKLEISEEVALRIAQRSQPALHQLRSLGVGIVLDNFGLGTSSLTLPQQFPFTSLKIDRSLVSDLGINVTAEALVRSAIQLGQGLELEVLAEGVETLEQVEFLRSLNCDTIQGFWYCQPMPADAIAEYLIALSPPPIAARQ